MRKTEIDRLDKLSRDAVKKIAGYQCIKCRWINHLSESREDGLECAHIIERACKTLRWEFRNLLCLCSSCHNWSHANPKAFRCWLSNWKGPEF